MPDTQVGVGAVAKTKQTCSRGNSGGPIRNKAVDVPCAWFAKVGGVGIETRVNESMLLEKFGKVYVNEVKKVDKGFVDVPVGQCKESSLQNYPHLCVQGAPSI